MPTPTEISAAGKHTLAAAMVTVQALEGQTQHALGDDLAPLMHSLERLTNHLDQL